MPVELAHRCVAKMSDTKRANTLLMRSTKKNNKRKCSKETGKGKIKGGHVGIQGVHSNGTKNGPAAG